MNFLSVDQQTFLITGVSNKKSIAFFTAQILRENGATCLFTAETPEHRERIQKLFPDSEVFLLDVRQEDQIHALAKTLTEKEVKLSGLLHSMAFANYAAGIKPFHLTDWKDYVEATQISQFSLVALSGALKDLFLNEASVVTVSISNTKVASYGYMGPIKAALETTVSYLSKSFSEFSRVRFNAVCAGPLKTSASAGIPHYIENYLYAEKLTLRKEALKTAEVAQTIAFLLSQKSSGINGTGILVDAGMALNTFDQELVFRSVNS